MSSGSSVHDESKAGKQRIEKEIVSQNKSKSKHDEDEVVDMVEEDKNLEDEEGLKGKIKTGKDKFEIDKEAILEENSSTGTDEQVDQDIQDEKLSMEEEVEDKSKAEDEDQLESDAGINEEVTNGRNVFRNKNTNEENWIEDKTLQGGVDQEKKEKPDDKDDGDDNKSEHDSHLGKAVDVCGEDARKMEDELGKDVENFEKQESEKDEKSAKFGKRNFKHKKEVDDEESSGINIEIGKKCLKDENEEYNEIVSPFDGEINKLKVPEMSHLQNLNSDSKAETKVPACLIESTIANTQLFESSANGAVSKRGNQVEQEVPQIDNEVFERDAYDLQHKEHVETIPLSNTHNASLKLQTEVADEFVRLHQSDSNLQEIKSSTRKPILFGDRKVRFEGDRGSIVSDKSRQSNIPATNWKWMEVYDDSRFDVKWDGLHQVYTECIKVIRTHQF